MMNTTEATRPPGRLLRPGQRADLMLLDVATGTSAVVLTCTERLIEAPMWHPGGDHLVVNADGLLFRITVDDPVDLDPVAAEGLPPVNNDHVLTPDGRWHVVSARDGHLYRLPWEGGTAERLTTDKHPTRRFRHFLHGVSPDGRTLAYVGTETAAGDEWGRRALWTLDLRTGREELVGDGYSPADGPEFSPDGSDLYFNAEFRSTVPGHAQLFRRRFVDGSVDQLTDDERVNWFPHPSPDGTALAYLSYPPGTEGHPADLPVALRLIDLASGTGRTVAALPGGQGTINVNSWAPGSDRLAYIAYPVED